MSSPAGDERPAPARTESPGVLGRFAKLWAALAAGAVVVTTSGLLTQSATVWISTASAAGSAALAVLLGPANRT